MKAAGEILADQKTFIMVTPQTSTKIPTSFKAKFARQPKAVRKATGQLLRQQLLIQAVHKATGQLLRQQLLIQAVQKATGQLLRQQLLILTTVSTLVTT